MGELKSSYEIALEKLKARGQDDEPSRLSEGQKTEIAELRKLYLAKTAERELAHQERLKQLRAADPAEYMSQRDQLQQAWVEERRRLEQELEHKLEAIRGRAE